MGERGDPTAPSTFLVRPLAPADLPALFRIQAQSFAPEFRESEAAILARMRLFGAGSLGCFRSGALCGYAVALPWRAGQVIGVAEVVEALPAAPDVMYLHDMVIAPGCRRQGAASALLAAILHLAASLDLDRVSLVAVQQSERFWERLGFARVATFEYVSGARATRMERADAAAGTSLSNIPISGKQTE